jgi:AcrR family transcriptional regulator
MPRETVVDSRQEILRTAARLFQQRGYDATSMNDVAAALKLSKGGLYHHFQSKDEILFEIMNHAMEITEERVLNPSARHRRPRGAAAGPDPSAHRSRA